jgi:hypothetical protein
MSDSARQSTVVQDIAPFNPPGTHPPGFLPPHFFPKGSAPINPSYPIRPPETANEEQPQQPQQQQQQEPPAPAYYPGPSPQMAVEVALQLDPAYQKLYKAESFMLATPNPLPLHNEMIQDKLELLAGLEEEAEEQDVKVAIRAVTARYTAELEASRRVCGGFFNCRSPISPLVADRESQVSSDDDRDPSAFHRSSRGEKRSRHRHPFQSG